MNTPLVPPNEKERLAALHSYHILDTFREEEYNKLTELASHICGMPMSLVTLIDEGRAWVKASRGIDVKETPREESICRYTILGKDLLEIQDASKDQRVAQLEGVKGEEHIRFYAGYPLIDRNGFALGALCVCDRKPNQLNREQREALKLIAETVVTLITERRKNQELDHFEKLFDLSNDLICIAGMDGFFKRVNPAFSRVLGWSEQEMLSEPVINHIHPDDQQAARESISRLATGSGTVNFTRRIRTKDGGYRVIQWVANPEPASGHIFAIGRDITEERKQEELLEKSQQRLSAFFEHSQGLMSTHDLEGNFLSVNIAGASLLGYATGEMKHMNLRDIMPPSHHPEFEKYLENIRENGRASGQMTTIHRNGSRRIWMYNNILEQGLSEEPFIIANAIDITDRYLLEKDLARTTEMLEQTNQVARVGGWVAEMAKEKIYWTHVTKELHGVPASYEPDLQSAVGFFKKGESQTAVMRAINRAMRTGEGWDMEVQIITRQGEERWVRTQGHAELEDGVCKRLYGSYQDINEKKLAQLEVANSRRLLQDVMQSASEVSMIATDKNGMITLFNKGAERLLGYTAEEMIGKQSAAVVHDEFEMEERAKELSLEIGEEINAMRAFVYRTEKEGSEQREWIYVKKDGSRCIVSLVITPIRDFRNNIVGYLGIATDITKRKRMEQALIAAKQQAEQVSNAKTEFLANMSHEIRTPLNGIIGFTDLVMKTGLDDTQKQYVTIVHQSANVLLSIINDILDLSKIEAGKLDLHIERSDLFATGREAMDIVSFQATNKGLEAVLEIPEDLPRFIFSDALRLKQVLVNLLGNAVKFTEKGSVKLRITALTDPKEDEITFKFEVRDTGIGIRADKQEKIFEAFAQEDASTTKRYGGTGIGLAISNKILALMGSKLQLISYSGSGSIFYFYLKLQADHNTEAELAAPAKALSEDESRRLRETKASILVVEDNTVNMLLTKTIIHKLMPQAAIIEAANGLDAVKICRHRMPDIILMDIQIPELNGYEATFKIRAMERNSRVPIIALTAGNISGEREKSIAAGMDDFLSKPIVETSLSEKLRKWLIGDDVQPLQEMEAKTDMSKHFDENILKEYLGEDNVGREILALIRSELQKSVEAMEQFAKEENLKGLNAMGHKLRGTTSSTGLGELGRLALEFDHMKTFEPEKVQALLEETSAEVSLVMGLLQQKIDKSA
ncbi:PAS domain S-box protein [Chitinophaga barathri]|uniref:Sensory/regulatory protein RpfC n=1 Tax=Chitinophaga barathri TaxID=1647451 RepID=A0A3N4MKB0_9BACT|nr:PAS domain S-box protein [Chitinophaga barathri]RPD40019.1 PAS domain S-box protein [Chitinophaga barathri]